MSDVVVFRGGRRRVPLSIERLNYLASIGMSQKDIAASVGLSPRRLCERLTAEPELRAAVENGRIAGVEAVTAVLFKKALAGDNAAIRLWLTRFGGFKVNQSRQGFDTTNQFAPLSRMFPDR